MAFRVSIASGFYSRGIAGPVTSAQFRAVPRNSAQLVPRNSAQIHATREHLRAIPRNGIPIGNPSGKSNSKRYIFITQEKFVWPCSCFPSLKLIISYWDFRI